MLLGGGVGSGVGVTISSFMHMYYMCKWLRCFPADWMRASDLSSGVFYQQRVGLSPGYDTIVLI